VRWRRLFRGAPPRHLPRYLLARLIAYKLQANAFGELDRSTVRFLDQVARAHLERRNRTARGTDKAPLPIPPVPDQRSLKPGTMLVREHEGTLHQVMVEATGFAWNGTSYRSLSEVARAITGTRWNGPRFFGLRKRRTAGEERQ
jgi:hypothetical protein